jgi:hypothetical protein
MLLMLSGSLAAAGLDAPASRTEGKRLTGTITCCNSPST